MNFSSSPCMELSGFGARLYMVVNVKLRGRYLFGVFVRVMLASVNRQAIFCGKFKNQLI